MNSVSSPFSVEHIGYFLRINMITNLAKVRFNGATHV
jgi:hypothetical protein